MSKGMTQRWRSEQTTLMETRIRIEDYSRRSACDRCRDQKLRCDRPISTGSGQFTQCRRCVNAQVKCLTTFEARRQNFSSNNDEDNNNNNNNYIKSSGQPRKRYRDASSNSTERAQDTREREQQRALVLVSSSSRPGQINSISPQQQKIVTTKPLSNGSNLTFGYRDGLLMPAPALSSSISDSAGDISPIKITELTSSFSAEEPNLREENFFDLFSNFTDGWDDFDSANSLPTPMSSELSALNASTPDEQIRSIGIAALLPNDTGGGYEESEWQPQPQPNQETEHTNSIDSTLDRIMLLSVSLSQEARCAKKHAMPGPRLKAVLNRTLQNSEAFVSLLKELISLATATRSPDFCDPSHSLHQRKDTWQSSDFQLRGRAPLAHPNFHVDAQVALQLLSCNAALLSNYEVIGSLLHELVTTRAAENASILPHLPEVSMDGFSGVSSNLQVKLLTQVCVHMTLEMEAGLEEVRQSGLLTLISSNAFDAILGQGDGHRQGNQERGNALAQHVVQLMHKIARSLGHSLRENSMVQMLDSTSAHVSDPSVGGA